jgi:hypothetical protein
MFHIITENRQCCAVMMKYMKQRLNPNYNHSLDDHVLLCVKTHDSLLQNKTDTVFCVQWNRVMLSTMVTIVFLNCWRCSNCEQLLPGFLRTVIFYGSVLLLNRYFFVIEGNSSSALYWDGS